MTREQAIKELTELLPEEFLSEYTDAIKMGIKALEQEPKLGKWKAFNHSAYHGNDEDGEPIWREVTVYHCDMCNRRTVIKEKYCPNCGAKMQEDK